MTTFFTGPFPTNRFPEAPILLQNQVPLPLAWYSVQLQYAPNRRGNDSLLFRGQRFTFKRRRRDGTSSWRCSGRNCPVYVATRGKNQIQIENKEAHNHAEPGKERMKTAEVLGLMRQTYDEGFNQPTVLEPNQVPKLSTWYYVELKYAKNSHGSILLFRGYRYNRQKLFPDAVISWKCSERDCPAVVLTLGENCLKIKSHAHNHPCYGNRAMVLSKKASQLAPQYQNLPPVQQVPSKPPPLLQANKKPMPSTWYTAPLKFFRDKASKLSVRFHGHEYYMEKKTRAGDTVTWICPKPACTSFIITRGKDQVWLCPRPHNHEPSLIRPLKMRQSEPKQGESVQSQKASTAQKQSDSFPKNDNTTKSDNAPQAVPKLKEEVDPMGEDVEYIEIKVEPIDID